jgi:hypothetical protein
MVFSGWRAVVWLLAAVLLVGLLLAAVFWIGVLLAVAAVVGWVNLVLLPRVAGRVRLPQLVLAMALLPLLAAGGMALAGLSGVVAGGFIWAIGVALPRAVLWRVRRRLGRRVDGGTGLRRVRMIDAEYTLTEPDRLTGRDPTG